MLKRIITRDDIIRDKGQVEKIQDALNGLSADMPDKTVILALTNAIHDLQEFLIRLTWGL